VRKLLSRGYKSGSGSDADHNYNIGSAVSLILGLTSVQDSDIDFYMPDLTSAENSQDCCSADFDIDNGADSDPD
jgi:hypothetical protein